MAKQDFCFTYYDGDATRDTAHMNRLERGAYHDLVISQRKFGRLTIDQIKKILSKDFTDCWPAIELIMICEDGKYFIEWLENSIGKMRRQAKFQSENGKLGGRPKKESQSKANRKPSQSEKKPLGNEYGDGNGIENVFEFDLKTEIPENVQISAEKNQFTHTKKKNTHFVRSQWKVFLSERMNDPPERKINFKKLTDLTSYFLNWIRNKFPTNGETHQRTISDNNGKPTRSKRTIEAYKNWGLNKSPE
jgi:hypothetical protein